MKTKMVSLLTAAAIGAALMTGCSTASEPSPDAAKENTEEDAGASEAAETEASDAETSDAEKSDDAASDASETAGAEELANPWTESDEQGVAEATGFVMTAPEGASEVVYSYMREDGLAQMSYTLEGAQWNYRMEMADELTDISGMSYQWDSELDGEVSGLPAKYYGYAESAEENARMVQVVNWYDAVPGIAYSLSAAGTDLNGMDIQVFAESLYQPAQSEATGDAQKDRTEELENYFLGERTKDDGSTLTISDNGDGTFAVNICITRLCSLEDGVGTFEDHKMYFEVTDPNGEKMSGMIYRDNDNSLDVRITDSTWPLLPNDEVIEEFEIDGSK